MWKYREMPSDAQPDASRPDATEREDTRLDRLLDHWFGPTANDWPWYGRLVFTLAGSATFFSAWLVHVVGGTGLAAVPAYAAALDLTYFGGALGAIWFAGLTAWKNFKYGPIRPYLSSFFLPYLIWSLVVLMLNRDLPVVAQ